MGVRGVLGGMISRVSISELDDEETFLDFRFFLVNFEFTPECELMDRSSRLFQGTFSHDSLP